MFGIGQGNRALARYGSIGGTEQDLIDLAQTILLEEIMSRFPNNVRTGSALMAVSSPTYRKRVNELEARQVDSDMRDSEIELDPRLPSIRPSDSEFIHSS